MSPLESERQTLLTRLNQIDGELAGYTKQAVAMAARKAGMGLDRDGAKRRGQQVRQELADKRLALVQEKNRLTSRYVVVKAQLRDNAACGGGQGPMLDLLTEIRDLLRTVVEASGAEPPEPKPSTPPRVRNTE